MDFVKVSYYTSNQKQYILQMTVWLNHQESVHHFEGYLKWLEVSEDVENDKGENRDLEDELVTENNAEDCHKFAFSKYLSVT